MILQHMFVVCYERCLSFVCVSTSERCLSFVCVSTSERCLSFVCVSTSERCLSLWVSVSGCQLHAALLQMLIIYVHRPMDLSTIKKKIDSGVS